MPINNDAEANIRVDEVTGTLIEECVIGTSAASFTDPALVKTADNIRIGRRQRHDPEQPDRLQPRPRDRPEGPGGRLADRRQRDPGQRHRQRGTERRLLGSQQRQHAARQPDRREPGAGVDMPSGTGAHTLENNTITRNGIGIVGNGSGPGCGSSAAATRSIATSSTRTTAQA